ncbi:MAG TPA: tetratricopeptide repeat protein [Thermoanaerobaculia bacterium]|nr:tetratricopeptide repeat protein [Thermoanaerobaculia bacterium]
MGKTTLCAEVAPVLAETLSPGVRVLALDGRYAATQAGPVVALWQEVQAARTDEGWSQVLAGLQEKGLTAEALARALWALAQMEAGLLVYLDDAESLQVPVGEGELGRWRDPGFAEFWQYLVLVAEEGGPFGVLASSRYQPEGTPSRAVLPLPEMSRYEVVRLLAWMPTLGRMPAADRAWVAERVEGHPRTVEYLEALARAKEECLGLPRGHYEGENWRQDILEPILPETKEKVGTDLLLGKLWDALPPAAQEHLGRCSVLTQPVPLEGIKNLEPKEGTCKRLLELGLFSPFLGPTGNEWWAPHRLVTEEAQQRWKGEAREAHLMVAEWLEKQFEAESNQYWAERTVEHFLAAGKADRAWPTTRLLILHLRRTGRYREALEWVERALAVGPTGAILGLALTFQAQLQRMAGVSATGAEVSLLHSLDLVEQEDKPFVLNELGKLYRHQGQIQKAADYHTRSVEAEIAIKGEVHPDVAAPLHSLAGVLKEQGDLVGARQRLERSLEIKAQVFGTELHPDVAISMHELAGVLKEQGDLAGARQRLERSLEIQAQIFGTEAHPSVAASLHELAGVLEAQGDLPGARQRLERSLEIQAQVFGTEAHPSVAASLHELAGVLQAQGDLAGARQRLERSREIQAQVFGTEAHPSVATSLHSLAGVLQAQGDLAGAREKLERSLAIKVQVFGTEVHPSVAASLHELAGVLQAQGDLAGARQRLERSLEIQAQVYGTREHYLMAITEGNLGFLLLHQGEVQQGVELLVHAFTVFQGQLGSDHPYTRRLTQFFAQFAPQSPETPPPDTAAG